jgi:hypothetical protein
VASAPDDPPSRAWRVVAILIVGPILVLAYRTGSRITAEREADQLVRPLAAITADGRPDRRAVLHVTRGSDALLEALERTVREGDYWKRAPILRALAASGRLELLRSLVAILRDGCVDLDLVAGRRAGWPFACLPPDELALSRGDEGRRALSALASDHDPFVRAYAHTFDLASSQGPIDVSVLSCLTGKDDLLRGRAAGLLVNAFERDIPLAQETAPALVALVGATPLGRVAARLVAARFPGQVTDGIRARSEELSHVDLVLARDERATARASRALARGDPEAASVLGGLASRDASAIDALIAAVDSSQPIVVRRAAVAALASTADPRGAEALRGLAADPDPAIQAALGKR